jgi:hypothetical protein
MDKTGLHVAGHTRIATNWRHVMTGKSLSEKNRDEARADNCTTR